LNLNKIAAVFDLVPNWDYIAAMRIVATGTLRDYWSANPAAEQPLKAWVDEAREASWATPHAIKEQFGNASLVGNNRVVFNIKGNDYRLIVAVAYRFQALYIKFIGTHAEYDQVDASTVEME
jgi:mRNA interferase HigB